MNHSHKLAQIAFTNALRTSERIKQHMRSFYLGIYGKLSKKKRYKMLEELEYERGEVVAHANNLKLQVDILLELDDVEEAEKALEKESNE